MKKVRFVVDLDEDDALLLKVKLKEKGFDSLIEMVRKVIIKKEAKNPIPCKRNVTSADV